MRRTNLNVKFAVDCLQGNDWNIERAIENFNQVKVCCYTVRVVRILKTLVGYFGKRGLSLSHLLWLLARLYLNSGMVSWHSPSPINCARSLLLSLCPFSM